MVYQLKMELNLTIDNMPRMCYVGTDKCEVTVLFSSFGSVKI